MPRYIQLLESPLSLDLRTSVKRRADQFERDFNFHAQHRQADAASRLERAGWSRDRLRAVFYLTAYNQVVLSPFTAPARSHKRSSLTRDIPVSYGRLLLFDAERTHRLAQTKRGFQSVLLKLSISPAWADARDAYTLMVKMAESLK